MRDIVWGVSIMIVMLAGCGMSHNTLALKDGKLVQPYGVYEDKEYHIKIFNDSIKVIPAQDKKVYSLSDGVIYYVGKNEYLDQVVVIKYDETYMIYAKLVDVKEYIKKGLKVSKDMVLGEVDTELVFQMVKHGKSVNPMEEEVL